MLRGGTTLVRGKYSPDLDYGPVFVSKLQLEWANRTDRWTHRQNSPAVRSGHLGLDPEVRLVSIEDGDYDTHDEAEDGDNCPGGGEEVVEMVAADGRHLVRPRWWVTPGDWETVPPHKQAQYALRRKPPAHWSVEETMFVSLCRDITTEAEANDWLEKLLR